MHTHMHTHSCVWHLHRDWDLNQNNGDNRCRPVSPFRCNVKSSTKNHTTHWSILETASVIKPKTSYVMVSSYYRCTFILVLQVYFPQFVTSDLYFKYLGELINTVQTQDLPGIRRKRTGTSPYFRSAQSKLIQTRILMVSECKLAMVDKHGCIKPCSHTFLTSWMVTLTLMQNVNGCVDIGWH